MINCWATEMLHQAVCNFKKITNILTALTVLFKEAMGENSAKHADVKFNINIFKLFYIVFILHLIV